METVMDEGWGCPRCGRTFETEAEYDDHKREHDAVGDPPGEWAP
jgi:hypothetical protein